MSSLAFVTHPSVRIKGTENAYTPTQCIDDLCPVKAPHLHCPFCVKTDAYQDPVILKAHYRVKHVDKGIDFAGLKILRCCDQCEIVGIIKGEKRLKGAHWHCYRCRNGFNRRDEAIKHYKTHFRNPQTTFQIQITQDLNSPPIIRPSSEEHAATTQDGFASIENPVQEIIHPAALSQTVNLGVTDQNVITSVSSGPNHEIKVHKVKVKPEPLEKELSASDPEDQQTIMIIQGDQLESAIASHVINSGDLNLLNKGVVNSSLSWEIRYRMEEEEKSMYKAKVQEYKAQMELLQQQVSELEAQLSQQMSMRLQEIVTSLSTASDPQKQNLGLQLAKVIEQTQAVNSLTGPQPPGSMSQELDTLGPSAPVAQEVSSPQLDTGNMIQSVGLNTSPIMTQLDEIPQGYQIISTTPEGHIVVGKTSDFEVKEEPDILRVSSEGETAIEPIAQVKDQHSMVGGEQHSVSQESIQVSMTNTIQAHVQDPNPTSLLNGELPQEDQLSSMSHEDNNTLLHVVTAADGLASLGTDLAVVAAGQDTFVVDIGEAQGLLMHRKDKETSGGNTDDAQEQQAQQAQDIVVDSPPVGEPPEKRMRSDT